MKTIYTIILIIAIQFSYSQIKQSENSVQNLWKRIYVKNVGHFDIPHTLEIQGGKYKIFMDSVYNQIGYDIGNLQLVAQPIGINDYEEGGLEKYSRVMLETQIKSPGEFLKLNFNISEVTSADKAEIDTDLKKVQQKALIKIGHKLITWYPVKVEKINGMSCIHLNFIRQFNENPNVLVNMYMFFNNDRVHTLTLSYRIKEKVYWESDFKAILKSFRITNIK